MKVTSTRTIAVAILLAACGRPDSEPSAPVRTPARPHSVLGPSDATVVMRGLNNPRGLAFGLGGALFVAEAGRGGTRIDP